ncbi:MAG: hypothetical protein AAFN70_08585 [Planctomycetota bacterium]
MHISNDDALHFIADDIQGNYHLTWLKIETKSNASDAIDLRTLPSLQSIDIRSPGGFTIDQLPHPGQLSSIKGLEATKSLPMGMLEQCEELSLHVGQTNETTTLADCPQLLSLEVISERKDSRIKLRANPQLAALKMSAFTGKLSVLQCPQFSLTSPGDFPVIAQQSQRSAPTHKGRKVCIEIHDEYQNRLVYDERNAAKTQWEFFDNQIVIHFFQRMRASIIEDIWKQGFSTLGTDRCQALHLGWDKDCLRLRQWLGEQEKLETLTVCFESNDGSSELMQTVSNSIATLK